MTKKQFNWLKKNQPFEVMYVEPYDRNKYLVCYHITSVMFGDGYVKIKGFKNKYNKESNTWKQIHYEAKIHYRNIRKIKYHKEECYKQYFNTV